jgi:hypothetical protein
LPRTRTISARREQREKDLSGHGFSRAAKRTIIAALAAEVLFSSFSI